jgi:hypothetical protein
MNANYTRDLLTLMAPLEDLKVLRAREGGFRLRVLLYGKKTPWSFPKPFSPSVLSG